MDFATILGVLIGVALVGGAITMQGLAQGTNPLVFVELNSFMIVLGGTLAATAIAFPLKEVLRLMTIMGAVFKGGKVDLGSLVDEIVDMGAVARKGPKDLEDALPRVRNFFLRDGLQMVVDGYSVEEIRDILGTRVEYREERETTESELFKAMGKFSPAFGIIGTLIGLVYMLKGMGAGGTEDVAAQVGGGMATALITTFYGAVLANLVFIPLTNKLKRRSEEEVLIKELIIEGILSIQSGDNPRIVEQKQTSFISPKLRRAIVEK